MMPDMDGYEVCRRIKKDPNLKHIPVIFLTAKSDTIDLVQGFEVGAIDYITKPFNQLELSIRIKTHISHKLALDEINILRGIIPICANCKNIKNDKGYWQNVENYIQTHSEAVFSHTICRDCARELYPELMDEIEEEEEEQEK
jgi:DNA-binding response OmpR family regulator